MSLILENVTVSYQRHPALHHVSAAFEQGSLTAIIGPNGAGKSTLLKAIAGLVPLEHGTVNLPAATPAFAYLPQQAEIDRSFPICVQDFILLGQWQALRWWRAASAAQLARVALALQQVGLQDFAARQIASLSVGQFQRVLFARLLVQDAPLMLLDETFNALDARTTHDLLHLIHQWQQEGRTVLAVLHDYSQVAEVFPQSLLLARECIAFGATAQVLQVDNLHRARMMAEGWSASAPVCQRD
jgi:zinc/manganese transport system ATP-binding protein